MNIRQLLGCKTKIRYRSAKAAWRAARKHDERYGESMRAYWCGFCKMWHLARRKVK